MMDDKVYRPGGRFWLQFDVDVAGTVSGPLGAWIVALNANPDVRDLVIDGLQQRTNDPSSAAIAKTLLAAIRISDSDTSRSSEAISELLENDGRDVPLTLWWQFGQALGANPELRTTGIRVLEYVYQNPGLGSVPSKTGNVTGYLCGVGATLTNAYLAAGQHQKARQHLLDCFEKTNAFVGNPALSAGYAVQLRIMSNKSIIEQLERMDAPLEAMYLAADVLSRAEAFEQLRRLSGRADYHKLFAAVLAKTKAALKPAHYRRFLERIGTESGQRTGTVNLLAIRPGQKTTADTSSIAAMAVHELAGSDEGRDCLRRTQTRLDGLSQTRPDDWELLALRAMIAVKLEAADAVTLVGDLHRL